MSEHLEYDFADKAWQVVLKETYWRQSVANCAAAVKLRDQGTLYGD